MFIREHLFIAFVGAISVGGAYFGEGSGLILGSIYCTGTESNLTLCSTGSVGQHDCHHGRDVGVICQGMIIVCWAGCCFEEDFIKQGDFALLLIYLIIMHADTVYTVTVVTDPSSGPHSIGSTVNFTCLVHPQIPGEGVTYQWRGYVPNTSPVVANSSLPYATLTIGVGHPHTARYHCQVYYRGDMLATGNTVITVQGRLHYL